MTPTEHSSSRPAHWTHASGWDVVGIAHLSVAYDPPPPPSPPPTTWVGKFFARIGLGILPPGRTPVRTRVDALEFWPKDRHVSADWLSMPGGLRQGRGQTS
jgi:hypothetical protein